MRDEQIKQKERV